MHLKIVLVIATLSLLHSSFTSATFYRRAGCRPPFQREYFELTPKLPWYEVAYRMFTAVLIKCKSGTLQDKYRKKDIEGGEAIVECLPTGKWSHDLSRLTCAGKKPPVYCKYYNHDGVLWHPHHSKYSIGQYVHFSCKPGFMMSKVDTNSSKCGDNGHFYPKIPYCRPYCLEPVQVGLIVKPWKAKFSYGEKIELSCKPGFATVSSTRECKAPGRFHPPIPPHYCKKKGCPKPPTILHGKYGPIKPEYYGNDTITYSCVPGYVLVGKAVRRCFYAKFTVPVPYCKEIQCKQPKKLINGGFSPVKHHYSIGKVIKYKCNRGYMLSGPGTAVCLQVEKTYTAVFTNAPVCKPIKCDKPGSIENGDYKKKQDKYSIGVSVTYTCDAGFKLNRKNDKSVCKLNAKGDAAQFTPAPECEPITCIEPGELVNGGFTGVKKVYFIGDTVLYSCDLGFYLDGPESAVCLQLEGTYKAEFTSPPVCQAIVCDPPDVISDGSYALVLKQYSIGDTVTYSCDKGFYLDGPDNAICLQVEGTITAEFTAGPECKPITCDLPSIIENGELQGQEAIYFIGSVVSYICITGFKLEGEDNIATCLLNDDGKSASFTEPPKCVDILCQTPDFIDNGGYSTENVRFTIGETVRYRCDVNYKFEREVTEVTCELNPDEQTATFTALPICIPILCDPPETIGNGRFTPRLKQYSIGENVIYTCSRGYRRIGGQLATCILNDDELTASFTSAPVCERIICPPPEERSNLIQEPEQDEYYVDDVVTFSCMTDCYELFGESSATCTEDGVFDNPAPECNLRTCDGSLIEDPVFGHGKPSMEIYNCDDVVTFSCQKGFDLIGSKETTCLPSGDFSDEIPICQIRTCSAPKLNKNVYIDSESGAPYSYQTVITYKCYWGFELRGASTAICEENREFSEPSPECEPLYCSLPDVPEFGVAILNGKTQFGVGDIVHFECNDYYVIVGHTYNKCGMDGEWAHEPPQCVATCKNVCYQPFLKERPCQCDASCLDRSDCCDDFREECVIDSCVGRCGSSGENGSCDCDASCEDGTGTNCCPDYKDTCDGMTGYGR